MRCRARTRRTRPAAPGHPTRCQTPGSHERLLCGAALRPADVANGSVPPADERPLTGGATSTTSFRRRTREGVRQMPTPSRRRHFSGRAAGPLSKRSFADHFEKSLPGESSHSRVAAADQDTSTLTFRQRVIAATSNTRAPARRYCAGSQAPSALPPKACPTCAAAATDALPAEALQDRCPPTSGDGLRKAA